MATVNAKIGGTYYAGRFIGIVPLILVPGPKPSLKTNGFGCISGQADLHVPGLPALQCLEGGTFRQGHVLLVYEDMQEFLAFASPKGTDVYCCH